MIKTSSANGPDRRFPSQVNWQPRRATMQRMESLALFFSASGRIAPRTFALGVAGIYICSFLSQVLISPPVTARVSVLPFAIVQVALIRVWFALHAKRLRDAGRPTGPALGIAILYALAMVLLMLLIELIGGPAAGVSATEAPRFDPVDRWVFLLLPAALAGQPDGGFFYHLALVILVLILAPMAIAIGFSIRTGKLPRAAPPPPPIS
jgi:uncharacterized membrane protein YhaH (DUF805 family)